MKLKNILLLVCAVLLFASEATAQLSSLDAEQVRSLLDAKRKVTLVDTRTFEEYQQAHIPGAINIMPEQMQSSKGRLPRDKATPIIFYCRGIN